MSFVGLRIEIRPAAEHFGSEHVFAQIVAAAGERALDQKSQHPRQGVGALKRPAGQDFFEMAADLRFPVHGNIVSVGER